MRYQNREFFVPFWYSAVFYELRFADALVVDGQFDVGIGLEETIVAKGCVFNYMEKRQNR